MKSNPETPTTEVQHTKLRIEIDPNGNPRLYRGKEDIGVASQREVELYNSQAALLSVLQTLVDDVECYCADYVAYNGPCGHCEAKSALASARKEQS